MNVPSNLRYAFRQFKKNPGFFLVAAAALALGIGANTAIFSAVQAVLLKPLPYAQPGRLVMVWEDMSFLGFKNDTPAPANYVDWKARNRVFTEMAAANFATASLTGDGKPEQLNGRKTTANFFRVLGVEPALGRVYTQEEDQARSAVVVLGYELWKSRFGGDPGITGRSILLGGIPTRVLGVMPAGFFYRDKRNSDFYAPMAFTPEEWTRRRSHFLTVTARLKPGVSLREAQNDMERIAAELEAQYPVSNAKVGAVVVPLEDDFTGEAKSGLIVLQVASVCVLLIACSNLANLLLVRATSRRREIAVRMAMGASRRQIAAQLLTESLALAMVGGLAGLWIGQLGWEAFRQLVPEQVGAGGFELNGHVLLFTAGISLAAGILFGCAPALRATSVSLQDALKEGARAGESRGGLRLRDTLVVGQLAMAFALLVCAGLMIETLWNLRKQTVGFRPDHLVTMGVWLPEKKYPTDEKALGFMNAVLDEVRGLPGIEAAGFGSNAPFMTMGDTEAYSVEGEPPPSPGQLNDALYREVTPGYLEMLGASLAAGRFLDESDRAQGLPVLVVNEFLAKRHWPGQNAVGKRIRFGADGTSPWWIVAGVVKDLRERGFLYEMKPAVYVPVAQAGQRDKAPFLVARTALDPAAAVKALESAIWRVDAEQPVTYIRTMDQLMATDLADRTRPMILLGVFSGLALVLACLGVYGVLAYTVAQRKREIGVRMALGARPGDVTRMVLGRGLRLGATGLVIGTAFAAALGTLLRALLYGVAAYSPWIYLGTAAALFLVAAAACAIPARRAALVDPMVALRDE